MNSTAHKKVLIRLLTTFAALLIIVQVFFILKDSNWTLVSDDFDFLIHFASGIPFLPSENLFSGRFTPLAFLEYNIFIPLELGDNPLAFYAWISLKYIVALLFFFLIQREVCNLTQLSVLSKELKLIFVSASTITFLLLPGFFVVFLDVVYYENTSIPISLIFIYTAVSIFKKASVPKIMFLLVLFNMMLYLKETYFIFFLPFVLMGVFSNSIKANPVARKLILASFISLAFYSILYVCLVYIKTDVFYFEKRNLGFITGVVWLIFLNPILVTTLVFLCIMVTLNTNNLFVTPLVTGSAMSVCLFFLISGTYPISYQLSIVYPFVFFTVQFEIIALVKQKRPISKFVVPILFIFTLSSGFISLGLSRKHIIGRDCHFSILKIINQFRFNSNSLTYIYRGGNWQFSKLRLGIAMDFIDNGEASLQSTKSIEEIDSLSEIIDSRNAILFFPDNERQPLSDFESHEIDTMIEIAGFEYNAIVLKKN